MSRTTPVTIAHGDGIGPEIMDATLRVLKEAGAQVEFETIEIGESVYKRGFSSGIEPSAWESLRRTKVFLKAPITTPQGGGFKSLNVTIRTGLGLYANVRPCTAYYPFVRTRHPTMDVVIVRENEEDVYTGIEHRQTEDVVQCLKLISRTGSERLIRYAFEYARANSRKKVTCFSKDNIMKMTDGLFHKVFDEISKEYPDIQTEHWIVDIGAALLADTPDRFEVIVLPNLYGDILSDVAAQIVGSVGLAGSANIGAQCAMFEAIHGSAPRIAGQNAANPSGLLLASVMMLVHIRQVDVAQRIQNAWLCAIEEGHHTADIYDPRTSRHLLGTKEFAQAVIDRLGKIPEKLKPAQFSAPTVNAAKSNAPQIRSRKELVGIDVFFDWTQGSPNDLAALLQKIPADPLTLKLITNRGVKVWPDGIPETVCVDHWRCRYVQEAGKSASHAAIAQLLTKLAGAGLDFIKTENLYAFDGKPGYSLAQGE